MNDPLTQLERSHRRLEEACDALGRATFDRDIDTVNDVCAFFGRQVRRHEDDEEKSLFPRLEAAKIPDDVRTVLERLAGEHKDHVALHARLEEVVSGRTEDLWGELTNLADAITRAYRAHIADEERYVFPVARQLLSPSMLDEMSGEMDARRGRPRG